jgi:Outer membrane protein and related peptidoglycan-associated (lipo)proteins
VAVAIWDGKDTPDISTTTSTTTTTLPKLPPTPPIIPSDVLFDTDKADLKAEAGPVLQQLADQIAGQDPSARLEFIGFTDSRGTIEHNADLSRRRAEAVLAWFGAHGFDTGRLSAEGDGESNLLVPDTDSSGHFDEVAGAKNRRVEIAILP